MPVVTVRDVPKQVHEDFKIYAASQHRSVQGQIRFLMEEAVKNYKERNK